MTNRKFLTVLLIAAAVFVCIGGGYLLYSGKFNTQQPQPVGAERDDIASETTQPEAVVTRDRDARRAYAYNLNMLITSYRVTYGAYPAGSAEGWQHFLETAGTDFVDPYTTKSPVFTTTTPQVGEVQYVTPGTCALDSPELESSTRNTFAYRAYVAGRIVCYGNTSGFVE